ncbi:hypothetical protein [Clostridium lundense]|uniref:hypothetical protein n=1 Tax=Clostridium lundense TaxID=319475 RepID=UPI0004882867|nr:hypothetical protein [Clostridium lundense]
MINNSSRYDVLISDDYSQLDLDFILPKVNERIIHGTIWDDSDDPKKVSDAIILVFTPGPNYYDSDPNDIQCIDYAIPDSNGEFVAGPFKLNTTVILKIFNTNYNKINLSDEIPEEFRYINGELVQSTNTSPDLEEANLGK